MLDIQEEEYINFDADNYVIDGISNLFINLNKSLFSSDFDFDTISKYQIYIIENI